MTFTTRPDRERWDRDPVYVRNRATIRAQRRPCARCGGAIDYDGPYWMVVDGRKRINPRAFVCGHVASRASGGGHHLANLQAEHAACSLRSGASEGARRLNAHGPKPKPKPRPANRQASTLRW